MHTELDYVFTPSSNTVNSASVLVSSDIVQAGQEGVAAFPNYYLGNYVSMGTAYPMSRSARTTLELTDACSSQRGKHSVRLSGDATFNQVNSFKSAYPSGYFQFIAGYYQPAGHH